MRLQYRFGHWRCVFLGAIGIGATSAEAIANAKINAVGVYDPAVYEMEEE